MREKEKKVLVFGTFDIIHEGHIYFMKNAKKLGTRLIVLVARNINVEKIKGETPYNDEHKRIEKLQNLHIADKVILGDFEDPYKILSDVMPDIICLGYDQESNVSGLAAELEKRKLKNTKIIRIDAYKPEKFKSSLIKKANM